MIAAVRTSQVRAVARQLRDEATLQPHGPRELIEEAKRELKESGFGEIA